MDTADDFANWNAPSLNVDNRGASTGIPPSGKITILQSFINSLRALIKARADFTLLLRSTGMFNCLKKVFISGYERISLLPINKKRCSGNML